MFQWQQLASAPLDADVVGSGNAELYCLVAGKARAVALDAAPTGRLIAPSMSVRFPTLWA